MGNTAGVGPRARVHAVNFYEHDDELVDLVARFTQDGLERGERVVTVTTPAHREAIDRALVARGVDPAHERAADRLWTVDARTTLDTILSDGVPHRDRFLKVAGGMLADATSDGSRVRLFGEMVALLWQLGDVTSALELEELWNEMLAERDFDLLCGYPTATLGNGRLDDVSEVCAAHSEVLPPAGYAAGSPAADATRAEYSQVFLPVPEAVAAVRRFVRQALTQWGEADVIEDAALVASELATNAVLHTSSPFWVSIDRAVDLVCISIQDVISDPAEQQSPGHDEPSGRGMAIVEALSRRWGCEALPAGKVVWAELAATGHG